MDKKSKIFFLVMGVLILGSVAVSYYKYMVKRDYIVHAQADCDPYTEKCFVHVCDPDPDVDGECTGDPAEDTWYTKNINRIAYNIPNCDPKDESCTALVCGENELGCSYEFCDETNVPEGDTCNDPAVYTLENPVEEEVEEGIGEESDEEGAADESEGDATSDEVGNEDGTDIDTGEGDQSEETAPVQDGTDVKNTKGSNAGVDQTEEIAPL